MGRSSHTIQSFEVEIGDESNWNSFNFFALIFSRFAPKISSSEVILRPAVFMLDLLNIRIKSKLYFHSCYSVICFVFVKCFLFSFFLTQKGNWNHLLMMTII